HLDSALEPLLTDAYAGVRHSAVRTLPLMVVRDACFDPDARIAHSAALRAVLAGPDQPLASRIADSPHAAVRRLGEEERSRADPWSRDNPLARAAARIARARPRAAFPDGIRPRLSHHRP